MSDPTGLVAVIAFVLIIPLGIARAVVKASWKQCLAALGVLWVLLLWFGLASSGSWGERLGWPLILSLFFSIPLVPFFAWILKPRGML